MQTGDKNQQWQTKGLVMGWQWVFGSSSLWKWWLWLVEQQVEAYEFRSQHHQMHKGDSCCCLLVGLCFILFGLEACLLGKRNWENNLEKGNWKGNCEKEREKVFHKYEISKKRINVCQFGESATWTNTKFEAPKSTLCFVAICKKHRAPVQCVPHFHMWTTNHCSLDYYSPIHFFSC